MCIAIPMEVVRADGVLALCRGRGEQRRVNTALLGELAVGTWVLVHLDMAREILDPQRVAAVNDALDAVEQVMAGAGIEGRFADLVDREPELPEFLRPKLEGDRTP